MKFIFCSSIYNMVDYDKLSKKSKISLSLADHNLNYNIILGLDEALNTQINLINNVQIPTYPKFPKIMFRKQVWSHSKNESDDINCGFINLPLIKHLSRAITTFFAIKQKIKEYKEETICLLTYDLHMGISLAIKLIKFLYPKVCTCAVLPDIPNALLTVSSGGSITFKDKIKAAIKTSFIKQFDSYVFITEYMKDIVDVKNKSYTVVEGIYNNNQPLLTQEKNDKKIILYTGQLNPAYGMENLLDAFIDIYQEHKDYELWICGGGKLSQYIKDLALTCKGIKYLGYCGPEKIKECQMNSTVLINPRQNTGEFTKYSFPSKTMEYLASGKPVVGYKLSGIPTEYDKYINYVEDDSIEALKNKLIEICSMSLTKRNEIGEKSRKFILENKNPKKQCDKIVNMVKILVKDK